MDVVNTFGNVANSQTSRTQYSNNAPAPPFHLHNINSIDMNTQTGQYLQSQHLAAAASMSRGQPTGSQDFTPGGFNFPDGIEMDMSGDRSVDQPSPATISSQSRGGSTSQSSYSPGQGTERHLPYRASPKLPPGRMQTPAMGNATVFPGFNTTSSDMFTNSFSTSGNMNEPAYHEGFLAGNEWEFTAMNAGTGMTPLADGTWDSMLESVTMGWDTSGLPHDGSAQPPSSG